MQFGVVLFLVNSANAFGACCFVGSGGDTAHSAGTMMSVLGSSANETGGLPCHQSSSKAENNAVTENADMQSGSCCATCAPAAPLEITSISADQTLFKHYLNTSVTSPIHSSELLFRPPIKNV